MYSRARSIVVVIVVLLSVLFGVAAGTPIALAAGSDGSAATDLATGGEPAAPQVDSVPPTFESGASFWQGQTLEFDASDAIDAAGDRTFELWRVTQDGDLNQRVRTFTVDGDGTHSIETGSLTGRYVIRYDGQPVYVIGGTAYLQSPPDGADVTVASSAFRIERQTLAFTWSDPTVYSGQDTTLAVESNRANSVVAVSGQGLTFDDLTTVFPEDAYADEYDARADEDVVLLDLSGTTSVLLDTTALEPGRQRFDFDVVDTATVETVRLRVHEPDAERHVRSIDRREHVGDVVEAELACTHCFVVLGGPDQGFLDIVEVRDVDGDANVTLRINTRFVGMARGANGYPSAVSAYTSPSDSVERYRPGDTLEAVEESLNYDVNRLSDLRTQQGLEPNGRDSPIEPGRIRLTVSSSDFVIDRSAYGSQRPYGHTLVVRDEADVKTVTMAPRSPVAAESLAAPAGGGFEPTPIRLRYAAAPQEQVALGDRLVFRFDVPGVFGYLSAEGDDVGLETLQNDDEEGISLSLKRIDGQTASSVSLKRAKAQLVTAPSDDAVYLVVETGGRGQYAIGSGTYRAALSLEGVDREFDEYSTRGAHDGFPYLAAGETETASATATLSAATATISEPDGPDPHLTAGGELEVAGTTNVAPSSDLRVTAAATEYAWDRRTTARVRSDGSWETTFDLGDAPGDEFEVTVSRGSDALVSTTYTVRPAPEEPSTDGADAEESDGERAGSSGDGGDGDGDGDAGANSDIEEGGSEGLAIPFIGELSGLAVPIGGGLGGIVGVWAIWRIVIRRVVLSR